MVDSTLDSFTFQITGTPEKVDAFAELMRPLGLIEIARTGVAALSRAEQQAENIVVFNLVRCRFELASNSIFFINIKKLSQTMEKTARLNQVCLPVDEAMGFQMNITLAHLFLKKKKIFYFLANGVGWQFQLKFQI